MTNGLTSRSRRFNSSLPLYCYDDEGFPLRTLNLWCIPNSDVQVVIYPWQILNSFPDLTTDVTFPPSYYECVVYNLALRLSGQFGGNLPVTVTSMAASSMQQVKSINTPDLLMQFEPCADSGAWLLLVDQQHLWANGSIMPPFGFCGPSYTSQSPNADDSATINWYPERVEDPNGTTPIAMYPSPGIKPFVTLTGTGVRGEYEFNGRAFAVTDRFYEVFRQWGRNGKGNGL